MSERAAARLAFHGLVILLLGLLAGAPYGAAIVQGWGVEAERAWKLAHLEGVQNGILVLALAGAARLLSLANAAEKTVVWGAILAAYGNAIGGILGAVSGQRGLAPQGPVTNWIVFIAFMFGMWGLLIAVPVAAIGAWNRLRSRAQPH